MNSKLKYGIAAILFIGWLVLAWFIGSWLHLQGSRLWILRGSLAFIGLLALILLIWWFIRRDKERGEMGVAGPGGDEIDALIREAEKRLQASKLGKSASVGSLPLYLVLGETGSAKTTVVMHSGLEPELLAGQTMQDKAPVPTRAVNLWYTRQVIFAEAGGTMLQDRPRWVRLIRKLAPRQLHSVFGKRMPAPRAALVCVDSESFMKPGAHEALAASVERIRTRLRELSQMLGINLPVYVLFTRGDRLQFFQDYVRNLTPDQASVVFGDTLPMAAYTTGVYGEQETARISAAFDALFQSLADRRVDLLAQEFDANRLPTIYEYPREFRKLRTLLVQLVVDLCRPSQLRSGPVSARVLLHWREARHRHLCRPRRWCRSRPRRLMPRPAMSGATGIFDIRRARALAAQAQAREANETRRVPQWVFLPHVFSDVLLKDASALTASASSSKTSFWRRILAGGGDGDSSDFHHRIHRLLCSEQEPGKPGGDRRAGHLRRDAHGPASALRGHADQAGNASAIS